MKKGIENEDGTDYKKPIMRKTAVAEKKSLVEYLPKKQELCLIQAHIDSDIKAQVQALMKKQGLNWRDLFEALLKYYVDSSSSK